MSFSWEKCDVWFGPYDDPNAMRLVERIFKEVTALYPDVFAGEAQYFYEVTGQIDWRDDPFDAKTGESVWDQIERKLDRKLTKSERKQGPEPFGYLPVCDGERSAGRVLNYFLEAYWAINDILEDRNMGLLRNEISVPLMLFMAFGIAAERLGDMRDNVECTIFEWVGVGGAGPPSTSRFGPGYFAARDDDEPVL